MNLWLLLSCKFYILANIILCFIEKKVSRIQQVSTNEDNAEPLCIFEFVNQLSSNILRYYNIILTS